MELRENVELHKPFIKYEKSKSSSREKNNVDNKQSTLLNFFKNGGEVANHSSTTDYDILNKKRILKHEVDDISKKGKLKTPLANKSAIAVKTECSKVSQEYIFNLFILHNDEMHFKLDRSKIKIILGFDMLKRLQIGPRMVNCLSNKKKNLRLSNEIEISDPGYNILNKPLVAFSFSTILSAYIFYYFISDKNSLVSLKLDNSLELIRCEEFVFDFSQLSLWIDGQHAQQVHLKKIQILTNSRGFSTFELNSLRFSLLSVSMHFFILYEAITDKDSSLCILDTLSFTTHITSFCYSIYDTPESLRRSILVCLDQSIVRLYYFSVHNFHEEPYPNHKKQSLMQLVNTFDTKSFFYITNSCFMSKDSFSLLLNDASIAIYNFYDQHPSYKIKPLESLIYQMRFDLRQETMITLHHNPDKICFTKFSTIVEPSYKKVAMEAYKIIDFCYIQSGLLLIDSEGRVSAMGNDEVQQCLRNKRNKFDYEKCTTKLHKLEENVGQVILTSIPEQSNNGDVACIFQANKYKLIKIGDG